MVFIVGLLVFGLEHVWMVLYLCQEAECGCRHEDGSQVCVLLSEWSEWGRSCLLVTTTAALPCSLPTTFTLFGTRLLTPDQNVDRFYDEEDSLTNIICEKDGHPFSTLLTSVLVGGIIDISVVVENQYLCRRTHNYSNPIKCYIF